MTSIAGKVAFVTGSSFGVALDQASGEFDAAGIREDDPECRVRSSHDVSVSSDEPLI